MRNIAHQAEVIVGDHDPEPAPEASFFTGVGFCVDQIAIDIEGPLRTHFRSLRMAHAAKDIAGMKLAAESLSRISGQIQGLSGTVVRVSIDRMKRRPRA